MNLESFSIVTLFAMFSVVPKLFKGKSVVAPNLNMLKLLEVFKKYFPEGLYSPNSRSLNFPVR